MPDNETRSLIEWGVAAFAATWGGIKGFVSLRSIIIIELREALETEQKRVDRIEAKFTHLEQRADDTEAKLDDCESLSRRLIKALREHGVPTQEIPIEIAVSSCPHRAECGTSCGAHDA